MSLHWVHDTIPDHTHVTDGLGRRFIYHAGRFTYHGRFILPADVEFPVLEGEPE